MRDFPYILCTAGISALLSTSALAQSTPNFVNGFVPTVTQWNGYFGNKTDTTNGSAVNLSVTGGLLAGTFQGAPTFTGDIIFAGNPDFTGTPVFSSGISFNSLSLSATGTALAVTSGNTILNGTLAVGGNAVLGNTSADYLTIAGGASGTSLTVNAGYLNIGTSNASGVYIGNSAGPVVIQSTMTVTGLLTPMGGIDNSTLSLGASSATSITVGNSGSTTTISGNINYNSFAEKHLFNETAPLQATAITGATRLTSDGLSASGNTLNLPLNSSNTIACQITAQNTSGTSIGWTGRFGMTVNGAVTGTVLVGTPSWVEVFASSSGVASTISMSGVTADTTLGAPNITIHPVSGTWTVGGSCAITSTQQAI